MERKVNASLLRLLHCNLYQVKKDGWMDGWILKKGVWLWLNAILETRIKKRSHQVNESDSFFNLRLIDKTQQTAVIINKFSRLFDLILLLFHSHLLCSYPVSLVQ